MKQQFWYLTDTGNQRDLANWDGKAMEKIKKIHGPIFPSKPGQYPPGIPIHLRVSRRFTDFIWTWYSQCLIQDNVLQLFRKVGFSGFDIWPVEAKLKNRPNAEDAPEIPKLWELLLAGWGGVAPPESGCRLIEERDEHLIYTSWKDSSKLIDEDQWDGSDFFMVWPLPRFIFITDRVAQFIRQNRLTGVRLIEVEGICGPTGDKLSPGRLRNWMPEAHAHEIGDPLGLY